MHTTNIHEAKSQLSRLIEMAIAGEEVIISKAGKPVVKLVPYPDQTSPRPLGIWRGKVKIAEDFDELPPDLASVFQGETLSSKSLIVTSQATLLRHPLTQPFLKIGKTCKVQQCIA